MVDDEHTYVIYAKREKNLNGQKIKGRAYYKVQLLISKEHATLEIYHLLRYRRWEIKELLFGPKSIIKEKNTWISSLHSTPLKIKKYDQKLKTNSSLWNYSPEESCTMYKSVT